MADVFVSYKADDRRRVKPLVDALEADGLSVWWDERIDGGTSWRQSIEEELNAAKAVVVAWSKRSVGTGGSFVQDEAARAQQRRVYVPVTIDRVNLPLGFGETHALPLTGWRGNRSDPRYITVLEAVLRTGGIERSSKETGSGDRSLVSRRAVLAGGTVTVAAAAFVGWWFLLRPDAGAAAASIAVLPFANLSGDPAQAYFSDGLAEEIRNSLARLSGLDVVGRTSSQLVRDHDAKAAARKLGVASILIGSVRRSPSMVRVSAQLIDGNTGLERWSQTYDRAHGDVLAIQTDIAQNVASALSIALGSAGRASLTVGGTSNPAAQDLFLKAKEQLEADNSEAGLRLAIGLFDAAIALDPKFANAFAQKSLAVNALTGIYPTDRGFAEGYAQSAALAKQAIALAPSAPVGHVALARTYRSQLDMGAAYAEYQKARALSEGDIDVLIEYSEFLSMLGNSSDAIRLALEAIRLDPLNPATYGREATALYLARQFPAAVDAARRGLGLAPNRTVLRSWLVYYLVQLNRADEARAEFAQMPDDGIFRLTGEAVLHARNGDRAASDRALERMRQLFGDTASYQIAEVHAQRGEVERAFAALNRAWAIRDPGLDMIRVDPWLDPLRRDPRFAKLEQKLNFPPESAIAAA